MKKGKKMPGSGGARGGGAMEEHRPRGPKLAMKRMKSFRLAAAKIKRARKVLGTKTDTGTIEAALDMVVFRQELLNGLGAMAGVELTPPESMDAMR